MRIWKIPINWNFPVRKEKLQLLIVQSTRRKKTKLINSEQNWCSFIFKSWRQLHLLFALDHDFPSHQQVFNSENQFGNRITIYSPISFCFGHKQVSLIFLLILLAKNHKMILLTSGKVSVVSCCCFITRREGSQLKLHHLPRVRVTANTLIFSTAMPTYDFFVWLSF